MECRLMVFENRVLRIFGPDRDEVTRIVEIYKMRSCTPQPLFFG